MFKISFNISILLFFLVSCDFLYQEDEKREIFNASLIKSLSFENDINFNKSYLENVNVERPVGTWVRLIESESHCIDYRIPSKISKGELNISLKFEECEQMPVTKKYASLKNISDFKMNFTNNFINGKKVRNANFGVTISYKHFEENVQFKVLTFNLKRSTYFDKEIFKKYDSHAIIRWKKGLRVSGSSQKNLRSSPWPGSSKNDYLHRKINFCYRVDNRCEVTLKNHCNECLNGWISVVDVNCSNSGGSKICAPLECGKRGMPACPRGSFWKGLEMSDLCFNDSKAGYCESGLKTICDENKILTCI